MAETECFFTKFGQALADASRDRDKTFKTSTNLWPDAYKDNIEMISRLKATLANKPNVLIAGAGKQSGLDKISIYTQDWLKTGVHWSNFNPEINIDIITSTHMAPLEAALHAKRKPLLLIHGVYDKVPPILHRSFTIRWSDPFLSRKLKGNVNVDSIETLIKSKAIGVAPYLPSVRNTIFLNTMVMIWLGARQIVYTAVDPHNPDYFFTGNSDLTLEVMKCLSATNPWLAEWDGRNIRIPKVVRSTSHRVQAFSEAISKQRSAVGGKDYLMEFDRGFDLIVKLAESRGIKLGYIGTSSYMETTNIPRIY